MTTATDGPHRAALGLRAGARVARRRAAEAALRPLHRRRVHAADRRHARARRSTRRPRSRWPRSRSRARATSPAPSRPPARPRRRGQALPPLERGKYLFRIARLIQERARELAIVESLDGGKPIRESRDVDIPLAAAHFFSYAGWADKLQYALGGRDFEPRGVVGQVVPWNFPLLMAAWKLAPGAGVRQHGGPQAGRDDAADRAAAGRDLPGGRAAAGRRQHRHRRRRGGRRAGALRRRQGRLHRLDRGRQGDPARAGRAPAPA